MRKILLCLVLLSSPLLAKGMQDNLERAFQALGMGYVAYVRPVMIQNRQAFALHAADGTALTLVDSLEGAVVLARQNDLDAVTLQ